MSKVTAKVVVGAHVPNGTPDSVTVAFQADYADGRNKEWSQYTPSLSLQMSVKNAIAEEHFPVGRALLLTFEPADD